MTSIFNVTFKGTFNAGRIRRFGIDTALFAMLLQAMLPLTASAQMNSAFLVLCSAQGPKTISSAPQNIPQPSTFHEDCPQCPVHTSGPINPPSSPQVVELDIQFIDQPATPTQATLSPLWNTGPSLARGPPLI